MWKKILAFLAMLYVAAAFAAVVDVNKASAAELDSVKGIGPGISSKIIDERKNGEFKDWQDFISRVKGIGEGNAAKFSAEGLRVNGRTFKAASATKTDDTSAKDEKKATKAAVKEEKKEAKAAAKDEKKDTKAATKEDKPTASAATKAASAKK
jgi:competence protein ComEA